MICIRSAARYTAAMLVILLMFSVLPSGHAVDLSACESALTYESNIGDTANLDFLRAFKNDDRFAAWLSRRDVTAESLRTADDEFHRQFVAGLTALKTRAERLAYLDAVATPRASQRILDEFRASAATTPEDLPPRVVDLPEFLRTATAREPQSAEYVRRVVTLRAGDTVRFRDGEFRLGEFLGQGNATVIFALPDSDRALRIPLLGPAILDRGQSPDSILRLTVEAEPRSRRGRVAIIARSRYFEWVLVDRVRGSTNALAFVESLGPRPHLAAYLEWRQNFRPDGTMTSVDHVLRFTVVPLILNGLFAAAYAETRDLEPATGVKARRLLRALRRFPYHQKQYVHDESSAAWTLVDWE